MQMGGWLGGSMDQMEIRLNLAPVEVEAMLGNIVLVTYKITRSFWKQKRDRNLFQYKENYVIRIWPLVQYYFKKKLQKELLFGTTILSPNLSLNSVVEKCMLSCLVLCKVSLRFQ